MKLLASAVLELVLNKHSGLLHHGGHMGRKAGEAWHVHHGRNPPLAAQRIVVQMWAQLADHWLCCPPTTSANVSSPQVPASQLQSWQSCAIKFSKACIKSSCFGVSCAATCTSWRDMWRHLPPQQLSVFLRRAYAKYRSRMQPIQTHPDQPVAVRTCTCHAHGAWK